MTDYRALIVEEWQRRQARRPALPLFPLIGPSFDEREILAAVEVLLNGRLTMDEEARRFEREFADGIGAPYAVMVNSGSSANLLAVAACCTPGRPGGLVPGDEVLVPAVCWSTSVWPWIQHGLRPVFVDVDPVTLNIDADDFARRITAKTRAVGLVHVLGNSTAMASVLAQAARHNLLVVEDTCESLGTTVGDRTLGTLGDFGTFSFYYSHHITTGEGGMVVCRTTEDVDLLRSMRAHGWSRELTNRAEVERAHSEIDPRFLFLHTGYNLRPLELQGAMGRIQLTRLAEMNATRNRNRARLIAALEAHARWDGRFQFAQATTETVPAWFGFAALLDPAFPSDKRAFLQHLTLSGVENRPIISGNFTRQPGLRRHGIACDPAAYPGAEEVDRRGFFIGLHAEELSDDLIAQLVDVLLVPVSRLEGGGLTAHGPGRAALPTTPTRR